MTKSNARTKAGSMKHEASGKGPKVAVGEPFGEADISVAHKLSENEHRLKARTATLLVTSFVAFYGMYMMHEWLTGKSFAMIGQFLQTVIVAFVGWCIGKNSSNKASP